MHNHFYNSDARAQASPLAIALGYIKRGWNVLPVPYRKKRPVGEIWQHRTITQDNAHQFLSDAQLNIGVQLGPKSHGLPMLISTARKRSRTGPARSRPVRTATKIPSSRRRVG